MSFIENCKSPEEWCALLNGRGAKFSARRLRTKARELGEFFGHARGMLISELQIKRILEAEAASRTTGKPSIQEPNRDEYAEVNDER
uniref:hypothetical protein n=1 Tax=Brucella pseudintermedia TaxID=370111 RepID=UPI00158F65A1|nr:hypothetical protein [Brucella pseudintermedia]